MLYFWQHLQILHRGILKILPASKPLYEIESKTQSQNWFQVEVAFFTSTLVPVETRSIYVSANPVRFSKSLIPEQSSKRIPAHEQTTTRTQQTHARKGSGFQPRHFKTLGPRTLEGLEIIFFSLRSDKG